jgi:abhydrolase domain-containing protein 12
MTFRFNSTEALSVRTLSCHDLTYQRTSVPTLILHAVDDSIIPPSHSAAIFQSLISPNGTQFAGEVSEIKYDGWGTIRQATRGKSPVVWWEGEYGNHVNIGHSEGTIDLLAWVADL